MSVEPETLLHTDNLQLARIAVPGGWLYIACTLRGGVALQYVRDFERDWRWRDKPDDDDNP